MRAEAAAMPWQSSFELLTATDGGGDTPEVGPRASNVGSSYISEIPQDSPTYAMNGRIVVMLVSAEKPCACIVLVPLPITVLRGHAAIA